MIDGAAGMGSALDFHLQEDGDQKQALRRACGEFEAVLLHQIVRGLRKTISKCELFHGGQGEEMFQDFLDQEFCRGIARGSGLGLAELMYKQLSPAVEQTGEKEPQPASLPRLKSGPRKTVQNGLALPLLNR
ncbi:MAG: rod-binding protein [Deltaproteobacteria bacterium]|nr:rod-binding protein [Deltaproteobacteria bacterium]MBW2069700.1 rod-binding protein [Deltaproteobacteria bacterium]